MAKRKQPAKAYTVTVHDVYAQASAAYDKALASYLAAKNALTDAKATMFLARIEVQKAQASEKAKHVTKMGSITVHDGLEE